MRTPTKAQTAYWLPGMVRYARQVVFGGGYGRKDSAAMVAVCTRQLFWLYGND